MALEYGRRATLPIVGAGWLGPLGRWPAWLWIRRSTKGVHQGASHSSPTGRAGQTQHALLACKSLRVARVPQAHLPGSNTKCCRNLRRSESTDGEVTGNL